MNVSLDGFIETSEHSLDWTRIDEELHTWFKDQAEAADAFLYGRRASMKSWPPTGPIPRRIQLPRPI